MRTILACSTFIGMVSCSSNNEKPQNSTSDFCTTSQLRPSRYKLFEIVQELKALTATIKDPAPKAIYAIPGHWSAFFVAPKAGFEAAKQEEGFSGEFKAACNIGDATCVQDQIQLVNELTDGDPSNGEADAMGIGCKSATEMVPVITEAVKNTPVITFDSDVATPLLAGRHLYLGTMNLPAGYDAGQTMLGLLNSAGTVHIYAQSFAPQNAAERAAGVFEACLNTTFASAADFLASPYCALLNTDHICKAECSAESARGLTIMAHAYADEFAADLTWIGNHANATAEDYLADSVATLTQSGSPPVGVMSLQGTPGPVLLKVVGNRVKNDDMYFVAWDLSAEIQAGLDDGSVNAAMVQNSYFYGYVTAHIAYAMAVAGVPSVMNVLEKYFVPNNEDKLIDTGVTVVTAENLPFYLKYQVECLGLTTG